MGFFSSAPKINESQAMRLAFFDVTPDAQMVINGQGIIVDCNNATARMYGLNSRTDVIGLTPGRFSPPSQPDGQSSDTKAMAIIGEAMQSILEEVFERAETALTGELARTTLNDVLESALSRHRAHVP